MALESYIRARARLQRLADAKLFNGWLQNVNGLEISIECGEARDCRIGDEFFIQAFGPTECAAFNGKLHLRSDSNLLLKIQPPIRYVAATEDARIRVDGISVMLKVDDEPFEASVSDASRKGMGLVSPIQVDKGAQVELEVTTPRGSVLATGQVRYCRPDNVESGKFRVGIKLDELNRLDRARWHRILSEIAA